MIAAPITIIAWGPPGSGDGANILWSGTCPAHTDASGFAFPLPAGGLRHAAGIGIRATKGFADNATDALAANKTKFNVQFR